MKISEVPNYFSLALKVTLAVSIINSIYFQLWHLASTSVFLFVLLFFPQILRRKYKVNIPLELEFLLLLFVIASLIFGKIGGVITPLFFGIATSFIGFMIMLILYSTNQIKKNYFLIILFSFNFAVAFGFGLEFLKYYLKVILGHELTTGIYRFSMTNMTYVIVGALISAISGYVYMKNKKSFIKKIIGKFTRSNPDLFMKKDLTEEVLDLIEKGENEKTEFKSTLRVNLHTDEIDRKIEYSAMKTLTAFLNSKGGTLLVGISNNKEIVGIEKDRFENNDKLCLHLTNIIKQKIGKNYLHLIDHEILKIGEKTILRIECQKSEDPVFLRPAKDEEEFYIRAGPSSVQIKGSELVDYIEKKFRKEKG